MVTCSPTTAAEAHRADLLKRMALSAVALGDWPNASETTDEWVAFAEATGQSAGAAQGQAVLAIVKAVQGDNPKARTLLDSSEATAVRCSQSDLSNLLQLGRGIEALTAGRHEEAWAQLRQLVESDAQGSEWVRIVALSYLAEAALHRSGDVAACSLRAATKNLAHLARTSVVQGSLAYATAIARKSGEVDDAFDRALADCPKERDFDRARINLARGVCLRRDRRVSEARGPLFEALVVFERLGATAWSDRARGELRATGERRAHRELGDADRLTAQELQIVRMAAQGLSNREIGQRLFLSHRTIGSHLYRAFPKLRVAARSQLRDVLDDFADHDATLMAVSH